MNNNPLKRESAPGRWLPLAFYSANIITWFIIGCVAGAWDLLFLVFLPIPTLILYIIRTHRKIQ
jgi:hypothetical protein